MNEIPLRCLPVNAVVAAILSAVALIGHAKAANLDLTASKVFGSWESNRYKNSSNRSFCAAETTSNKGTIFRLNHYTDNREAFLEIYNPEWTLREGATSMRLSFDRKIDLELTGKSYGDAFIYELLEVKTALALHALLSQHSRVIAINANGAAIEDFSLNGSAGAIEDYVACSGAI